MAVPKFQKFFLPALRVVAKKDMGIKEATEAISDIMHLSDVDRDDCLPRGRSKVVDRVHWSITYLSWAGLAIRPSRGRYVATDEGRSLLATNPSEITLAMLMKYDSFRKIKGGKAIEPAGSIEGTANSDSETPEERIDNAIAELNSALQNELLEKVRSMDPSVLEKLIVALLVAMGYGFEESDAHDGHTADGGIDGIISEDELGLDKIYLQTKRYAADRAVGREKIQGFAGALGKDSKGVFVTTSRFTAPAKEYAAKESDKQIVLIDGDRLATLLIKHNVAVRLYRVFEYKRINEDYLEDLDS